MKSILFLTMVLFLYVGCSKEPEDYAKQILGNYKLKTLEINGAKANIPDSITAFYSITYNSFNKVDLTQTMPNNSSKLYAIIVYSDYSLSSTLTDGKINGKVNGNTFSFTLAFYSGDYMSTLSVK